MGRAAADDTGQTGARRAAHDPGRRNNYSLGRVDILAGNVGYLDIRGFSGSPGVVPCDQGRARVSAGTDAIIFDLRRNGGGSPFSVNLIISSFTTADTIAFADREEPLRQSDLHPVHTVRRCGTTTTNGSLYVPHERCDGVGG
jgi:hypothetical protein